jgi:hypothetical protein
MNRIPLPALIIVSMTAALLAVMVWTLTAAPDTSPPELPTMTAPPPTPIEATGVGCILTLILVGIGAAVYTYLY